MEHQADHSEGDHGFGDIGQLLIILGQAPPSAEPAEGSLDDPSAGDHDEAGCSGHAADDDQGQTEEEAGEQDGEPVVDAVGEHGLQPAVELLDLLQQIPSAVGVLNIGGVDNDTQKQSQRIDGNMALAPLHLLGGIVAAGPPFSVVLTLWVSMMAALGLASRPSLSRSVMTR